VRGQLTDGLTLFTIPNFLPRVNPNPNLTLTPTPNRSLTPNLALAPNPNRQGEPEVLILHVEYVERRKK